jgi:hypothetical protein
MPHSSNNNNKKNTRGSFLTKPTPRPTPRPTPTPTPTPTPITRPPIYSPPQQSTLWDSVKAGFGLSMGSRMFGFIFGDPTVKVEHKNQPPQQVPQQVPVQQLPIISNNKCDTLTEQIKFYRCDKELDTSQCDDLFRQFYKCQRNM